MSLDGLRAWIGEVERKLGMRTRVFLVLATIAIGGAGAAIYLAVDTREDAVSESDVQELQERLESRIAADAASAPTLPEPVEPAAPQPGPESEAEPKPESESSPESKSGKSGNTSGAAGDEPAKAKIQELLEQTKKENEAAEAAEDSK